MRNMQTVFIHATVLNNENFVLLYFARLCIKTIPKLQSNEITMQNNVYEVKLERNRKRNRVQINKDLGNFVG